MKINKTSRRKGYKRADRVGDLIKQEVADIIIQKVNNPVLNSGLITITGVKVTDDLKSAFVSVSILEEGSFREKVIVELTKVSGYIRHELGKRIRLKYIPVLKFHFDPSVEYADKINRILNEVMPEDDNPSGDNTDDRE